MSADIPEERTVEVQALSEDVDEELLCLYFENERRSGGGPLVSVKKIGTRAVLVFEDAEAAARVLARDHHVLHNAELVVSRPASKDPRRLLLRGVNPGTSEEMVELFVENMMGLSVEDYSLQPAPGRDVILIRLNQALSKDFQTVSTAVSRRTLDGARVTLERVEQTDSVLVGNLQPGASPDLLALYFESSRGGGRRVKDVVMLSEATAKVSFASYEAVDPVLEQPHKLDGADLVLKPYFDFLQPAEPGEGPESAATRSETAMDARAPSGPPVEAPGGPPLQAAPPEPLPPSRAADAVAEELMDCQAAAGDPVTSHVPIADPLKRALFRCSAFQEDLQKAHPNSIVRTKDDGVEIAGHDRFQLEILNRRISDFVGNTAEAKFTLEPEKARCLARDDVRRRLLGALSESGPPAVYSVSGAEVAVASLSPDAAEQAAGFLKSQVCRFSVPVESELEGLLCCREWAEFLQALSFCSAKAPERAGSVDGWTLKGMEGEKRAAILRFLATPIERETVISMPPGMLEYVQTHCHQLLADMDQVSIFPLESEDACGLKIHGPAVACQMAEEVLQGVVSSLFTKTITVSAPGVCRFATQEDCQSILHEMRAKFEVSIGTQHVPWKPIPYEGFFEYAWSLMSQKNFSKASAGGARQGPKPVRKETNEASVKGLLDEARKIVSAIDGTARDDVSELDQLVDMDDLDLYTAEEPSSLGDSDAEAPRPSGGRDGASGAAGLPDDMEEDAQLSLAIQYSMESSRWPTRDEEEQLQRALELSKSLTRDDAYSGGSENGTQVCLSQETINRMPLEKAIEAANTLQLVVFAGYSSDLLRVEIAFNKKVSQRQVEERVEHRRLRNLSEYHRKCLEVLKRKHAVDILVQGSIATVSGFKDFVPRAMADVKLLLEKMSTSVSDEEIRRAIQWVWHDPASSEATPYPAEANVFIENAWKIKQDKVDVLFDNQPHTINFERMHEFNVASGKSVKISRTLRDLGDLNDSVPEEEYSLISNLPEASRVDEESDEFQRVVKQFYETIQEYHSKIRIIQVERLTNRLLYNQYKLKKASVLQRAAFPEIERTLYHGTSEASAKEICIHGFNRSFCGKNATVYGQGVYFAVNSSLSVQDQYSPPNADGYKFVFVSKVLTGDYAKGCGSMKTAPLKETAGIPLRYDSVTDNVTRPSMFVIFNDTQAFPEYLVTCQKIHR